MKLLDWIIIILMIFLLGVILIWYSQHNINECTSNPLVYGAKELTKSTGYEFEGFGWFRTPFYTEQRVYFNSTNSVLS